ncbi:MAG: LD-carboxypeptidase, partial [Flavobacteriales bacterium]|nr:LD-carboxypeptidase [Flavobacteriales bacterium]
VEAGIVGGNLSVVYSQLGSPSQIKAQGRVLLLEDLDEYLYHIDRMFWGLKRAGVFEGVKGLILGGFTALKDNTTEHGQDLNNPWGKDLNEIVAEAVGSDVPIAFDVNVGHLADNRAIVFNKDATINFSPESLKIKYA